MRRVVVVLATSLLAAFGLAALLSEPGQAVTTAHISISNFTYSGTFHVQPGETVEVVNNDPMNHTLTDKRTHLFNTGTSRPAAVRDVHGTDQGRPLSVRVQLPLVHARDVDGRQSEGRLRAHGPGVGDGHRRRCAQALDEAHRHDDPPPAGRTTRHAATAHRHRTLHDRRHTDDQFVRRGECDACTRRSERSTAGTTRRRAPRGATSKVATLTIR